MTYRAVEVLKKATLIAAEDTRTSYYLLKHYGIETPLISYHKFNEKSRIETILGKIENGEDVAVITDAGTPGIADPAAVIIAEAIRRGFEVTALPGATAFLPALVASGLSTESFLFSGFLPSKEKGISELLDRLASYPETLIFYEAPHRLEKTLERLHKHLGNRSVVIAREISKKFESYYRGMLEELLVSLDKLTLKGEFVILVSGAVAETVSEETIRDLICSYLAQGLKKSAVVKKMVEELKLPKNRVYQLVVELTAPREED